MAEILVLGAGMVGIGAALALQARGHAVTVVDRRGPGEETSFGNAGVLQAEAMEPYAMPRDLPTLLRYALGRSNDVAWSLRDLPSIAPALLAYFRASAPERHARISRTYAQLIARVVSDHSPLIEAAGANNLIRRTGLGEIYRTTRAFDAACARGEKKATCYGLRLRALAGTGLASEEPAIAGETAGALIWEDSWSSSDPGGLVMSYAQLFRRRGGRLLQGDAQTLERAGTGWRIDTGTGLVDAQHAVIALGPWSGSLLLRFGYRIQMLLMRGYHSHVSNTPELSRPYLDAENGYVMSSMRDGLRLTTGVEFVRPDRPQSRRQLDWALHSAAELLAADMRAEGKLWHGHRPFLPDMLPLVGPAPRHEGLWFDFGHGYQGFTLGPTTGELLAEQLDGDTPPVAQALLPAARL
ncbi:NAD(P)/FAD-dependent oxidoreductase [Chelativorans alearense]|uniref:NAD(P)/FAD-dependent oxidoreductase n=1 Tax=Chelativorans alearense TaxID=2681495 RepID=UPI0013D89C1E|nr:FAD-dependent oxidoreductase [Chelativorans alearense]